MAVDIAAIATFHPVVCMTQSHVSQNMTARTAHEIQIVIEHILKA